MPHPARAASQAARPAAACPAPTATRARPGRRLPAKHLGLHPFPRSAPSTRAGPGTRDLFPGPPAAAARQHARPGRRRPCGPGLPVRRVLAWGHRCRAGRNARGDRVVPNDPGVCVVSVRQTMPEKCQGGARCAPGQPLAGQFRGCASVSETNDPKQVPRLHLWGDIRFSSFFGRRFRARQACLCHLSKANHSTEQHLTPCPRVRQGRKAPGQIVSLAETGLFCSASFWKKSTCVVLAGLTRGCQVSGCRAPGADA
jgi:hypothetical protein